MERLCISSSRRPFPASSAGPSVLPVGSSIVFAKKSVPSLRAASLSVPFGFFRRPKPCRRSPGKFSSSITQARHRGTTPSCSGECADLVQHTFRRYNGGKYIFFSFSTAKLVPWLLSWRHLPDNASLRHPLETVRLAAAHVRPRSFRPPTTAPAPASFHDDPPALPASNVFLASRREI